MYQWHGFREPLLTDVSLAIHWLSPLLTAHHYFYLAPLCSPRLLSHVCSLEYLLWCHSLSHQCHGVILEILLAVYWLPHLIFTQKVVFSFSSPFLSHCLNLHANVICATVNVILCTRSLYPSISGRSSRAWWKRSCRVATRKSSRNGVKRLPRENWPWISSVSYRLAVS